MVVLVPVDIDDERLGRLLQLYAHEWSGLITVPLGDDALFVHPELHDYRSGPTRAVFLFMEPGGTVPLGFALVCCDADGWHVKDFFVVAGARRRGIGASAAEALFAARPGRWTLTVRPENPRALAFWRRVRGVTDERIEVGADGIARTRLWYDPT